MNEVKKSIQKAGVGGERERETDRQTDRQTETERDRETERLHQLRDPNRISEV
jgi:hypothetical protein